jgi:FAD:protein FMN transferase
MQVASAWSDTTFGCMGSTARLLVLGGPRDLADRARERLVALEAHWSRFQPDSELCRLNAAAGAPVVVSRDTFAIIELAVAAWRSTGGRFDPTVLDALEQAGYDRTFDDVTGPSSLAAVAAAGCEGTTPGCDAIELDSLVGAVRLPIGVHLDLGGIGKGYAADLVAAELLDRGADGVCVNLGGDVRVCGMAPEALGWQVDLDPGLTGPDEQPRSFRLGGGAVATSTRLRRSWTRAGTRHHHLIDPTTSRSAWTGLAAVTVLADGAAWAEILAKAAFVAGPVDGAALLRAHQVTGVLVRDDGRVDELPGVEAFLADAQPGGRTSAT